MVVLIRSPDLIPFEQFMDLLFDEINENDSFCVRIPSESNKVNMLVYNRLGKLLRIQDPAKAKAGFRFEHDPD